MRSPRHAYTFYPHCTLRTGKYKALCQRPGKPVAVWRDTNQDHILDTHGPKDVGVFYINIHHANIPNTRSYANRKITIRDLVCACSWE